MCLSREIEEDRNEFCDDVNFQAPTPLELSKLLPFMIKFSANVQLEKLTFWVYFCSFSYISYLAVSDLLLEAISSFY